MRGLEEIFNGMDAIDIGNQEARVDCYLQAQAESLERIADALESLVSDVSMIDFQKRDAQ